MGVNLRPLLGKMNNVCKESLESSIHFCLSKKKNSVEFELWLLELLKRKDSAIYIILEHCGINVADLVGQLYSPSYELSDNNLGVPSLGVSLVEAIKKSWLITSVDFNSTRITSGHLLYTIVLDPCALGLSSRVGKLLNSINIAELKENFPKILQNSIEHIQEDIRLPESVSNNSLGKFTVDLTKLAQEGKLDRAIGREYEINQAIDILCRRKQNNPLLVGEAGVGKTAIAEELAFRIIEDAVPDILKGSRLLSIDLASLQAGANIKGEFEQRLKDILAEIKKSPKQIILFIDEIHNIIGSSSSAPQNDLANLLKPELARGDLFVIGATTWKEYKKFFEKDAALKRRFELVKINEPSESDSVCILRNVANLLEKYHGVRITEKAIQQAVKLSIKYVTEKYLPDKAISLLDSACSRVKLSQTVIPIELQQIQKELELLQMHIHRLDSEINPENQSLKTELLADIDLLKEKYQKAYDSWQQKIAILNNLNISKNQGKKDVYLNQKQELLSLEAFPEIYDEVNEKVIANVVSFWTGIPVPTQDSSADEIDSLLNLESKIHERIVGQDYAVKQIIQNIRIAKANISDPRKPLGVFLLVGESGIGKTETALSIAETIYGHESKIITINMSEYKEAHKISSLIGSPPGYVGYGEGGKLTEQVRKNPYSVVLLDEMEKAHKDVQELFLQVFDKGTLTDSEGVVVNFKNTVIIMTSNACAHKIGDFCSKSKKLDMSKLEHYLSNELLSIFKPEFLGRLKILPYLQLDNKVLEGIIKIQFEKISERIKSHYNSELHYDADVKSKIIAECKSSKIGARIIEQIINTKILPELSIKLLEAALNKTIPATIKLGVKEKKFLFEFF